MSDGHYGLRITSFMQEEAKKSTCFPPLCTLGNTFNEELAYNMGLALGEECLENKIDIILGPGINIKRNPLCGRNFEYISEDPYLSGTLASNYIKGVQQKGVGTSLKHFACNSEEENRCISSSNVDLRALRESKNLTRQQLAIKLGVTQSSIHRYENMLCNPSLQVIYKYTKIFNISMEDLCTKKL
jgi:beta-glucosidase